ncbi:hypothetical protein [Superficieibacter electus]|nr:hypothetical protein [Superficieibacter electus]
MRRATGWRGHVLAEYDAAERMTSRMVSREGSGPTVMDSHDRLMGLCYWRGEQWEYHYDVLGRRTEKRCRQKVSALYTCVMVMFRQRNVNTAAELDRWKRNYWKTRALDFPEI